MNAKNMLSEMKNQKPSAVVKENRDNVTRLLKSMGEDLYILKFGLYKIAISNALIEYMGYDVEEFVVETIKYRTVLCE